MPSKHLPGSTIGKIFVLLPLPSSHLHRETRNHSFNDFEILRKNFTHTFSTFDIISVTLT